MLQGGQPFAQRGKAAFLRFGHASLQRREPGADVIPVGHGDLRGVRRRGRPRVRDIVGDGDVRLVTDGGDDGDLRFIDGTRHTLVVERPEVLDGAAAAARDDEVRDLIPVCVAQRADDLRRGLGSLHAHAEELDLRQRPARAEDAEHIMHRRAGGRGDDGDGLRVFRQRLFVRGIEKPLALQLRLELLKGDVQVARALRR